MVGGSLWVLRLVTTKTGRHDIAESGTKYQKSIKSTFQKLKGLQGTSQLPPNSI